MESLFKAVSNFCVAQGFERTYWLAYSGGLDSRVLLDILADLRSVYPIKLRAVYINHGLSQNADQWAAHCKSICAELAVDFYEQLIHAKADSGQSPEEVARQMRYAAFSEKITLGDILLTAHHQNDQAETLLLQLLRGSGLKGLAAMPAIKPFANGWHARPLLGFTREELQQYAELRQLHWINDESNENTDFSRNFIRHEVLPILKKRWPSVTDTLARVAGHCAESQVLVGQLADQDLIAVKGKEDNTLSIQKLAQLDKPRQAQVVRAWLQAQEFPVPSAVKMQQILYDMLYASEDRFPHFAWGIVELRRFRGDLYAMTKLPPRPSEQEWDLSQELEVPEIGVLSAAHLELRLDILRVMVRFRKGGELCLLRGKHRQLKKLFQEWGVPTWMRDRVPLIFVGDKLIAVYGFWVGDEFKAKV